MTKLRKLLKLHSDSVKGNFAKQRWAAGGRRFEVTSREEIKAR